MPRPYNKKKAFHKKRAARREWEEEEDCDWEREDRGFRERWSRWEEECVPEQEEEEEEEGEEAGYDSDGFYDALARAVPDHELNPPAQQLTCQARGCGKPLTEQWATTSTSGGYCATHGFFAFVKPPKKLQAPREEVPADLGPRVYCRFRLNPHTHTRTATSIEFFPAARAGPHDAGFVGKRGKGEDELLARAAQGRAPTHPRRGGDPAGDPLPEDDFAWPALERLLTQRKQAPDRSALAQHPQVLREGAGLQGGRDAMLAAAAAAAQPPQREPGAAPARGEVSRVRRALFRVDSDPPSTGGEAAQQAQLAQDVCERPACNGAPEEAPVSAHRGRTLGVRKATGPRRPVRDPAGPAPQPPSRPSVPIVVEDSDGDSGSEGGCGEDDYRLATPE